MNLFRPIAEAYGILFVRTILFILAIATVVIEAVTISIYNKRVASSPGILAPPSSSSHHYPLVINAVSLIPSLFSVIWSLAYLIIITRRLIQTHHRRREDSSSSSSAANEACNGGRRRSNTVAVLHPGLVISLDTISWIFFLVMAVLTGTQASNWKSGQVPTGSEGATTQVILSACPTFDQSTGVLNYWCDSPSWGEVVELTTSATSLLGTLTGIHSSQVVATCIALYQIHRHRGRGHTNCENNTSTTKTKKGRKGGNGGDGDGDSSTYPLREIQAKAK